MEDRIKRYKSNPHYKMSIKQERELETQRLSEKLVELFKQIKELGFIGSTFTAHGVPVLELSEDWLVVRKFTPEGTMFFTANFVGKGSTDSSFGITLYGDVPTNNVTNEKELKVILEQAYKQGSKDTKEKLKREKK